MLRVWSLVVLISLLLDAALAQSDSTQSGCDVCASSDDCSRAYRGQEGQFCGNWLDRQSDRRPCCCPVHSVCKVSTYACNCGYAAAAGPPARPYGGRVNDGGIGLVWLWWLLGSLALVLCCCGCCFMASKRMKERNVDNAIPVAAPVSGPAYASAPPDPRYSTAAPVYGGNYARSGGGMGAGTGAALGAGAGLLGGLALGHALGDRGDGGDYGGDGGFGGYDGGFGGDDGGGGDYDGGGGDFAGDI